jgi:hypothetical protein
MMCARCRGTSCGRSKGEDYESQICVSEIGAPGCARMRVHSTGAEDMRKGRGRKA